MNLNLTEILLVILITLTTINLLYIRTTNKRVKHIENNIKFNEFVNADRTHHINLSLSTLREKMERMFS